MSKSFKHIIIKCILFLAGGVLTGFLLCLLSSLLPTTPMKNNLMQSMDSLSAEGDWRPVITGYNGTQLDNYTDCLLLNIAVYQEDDSFLSRALDNRYAAYPDQYSVSSLSSYLNHTLLEDGGVPSNSYARYWLGGEVILRPLLLLLDYNQIRILNGIVQLILFLTVIVLMWKKGARMLLAPFILGIIYLYPVVLPYSLQFSAIYYIFMIAILVLLISKDALLSRNAFPLYFLCIGMATSYIDFLTYPVLTLGIPLLFVSYFTLNHSFRKTLLDFITNCVTWVVGYGGMWAGKWILGSLFLQDNIILYALRTVKQRSSMKDGDISFTKKDVYIANFNVINRAPLWICFFIILAFTIILVMKNTSTANNVNKQKTNIKEILISLLPVIFIGLFPIAWYTVVGNHSYVHSWYTYRELSLCVLALMSLLPFWTKSISTK